MGYLLLFLAFKEHTSRTKWPSSGRFCTEKALHRGIADGGENVQLGESSQRVDGLQGPPKRLVEYITDPRAAAPVKDARKDGPEWRIVATGSTLEQLYTSHISKLSGSAIQAGVVFPSLSGRNELGPPAN